MEHSPSKESPPVIGRGRTDTSLYGAAVLVDKPREWTSFDVVKKLRSLTDIRKIGHAGSLDPLATGLLICCLGRPATREIESFMEMQKVYEGQLRLGAVTPSYDAETEVTDRTDINDKELTDEKFAAAVQKFVGVIRQRPPMYSAVKVEGERLYKKARRGERVERPPRVVTVEQFDIVEREERNVSFRVTCSKGTYIRSLVHDLGQELGVGAYLTALRRTAIGPHHVEDAWTVEDISEAVDSGMLTTRS